MTDVSMVVKATNAQDAKAKAASLPGVTVHDDFEPVELTPGSGEFYVSASAEDTSISHPDLVTIEAKQRKIPHDDPRGRMEHFLRERNARLVPKDEVAGGEDTADDGATTTLAQKRLDALHEMRRREQAQCDQQKDKENDSA